MLISSSGGFAAGRQAVRRRKEEYTVVSSVQNIFGVIILPYQVLFFSTANVFLVFFPFFWPWEIVGTVDKSVDQMRPFGHLLSGRE